MLNTEKRWPSSRNVVKGMNLVENEEWALQYMCSCRQFDLPARPSCPTFLPWGGGVDKPGNMDIQNAKKR
jgi:hypothetical protein